MVWSRAASFPWIGTGFASACRPVTNWFYASVLGLTSDSSLMPDRAEGWGATKKCLRTYGRAGICKSAGRPGLHVEIPARASPLHAGRVACGIEPAVDLVAVVLDPGSGLLFKIFRAVRTFVHHGVLIEDRADRNAGLAQKLGGCRVLFQEIRIRHRPDVVGGPTQITGLFAAAAFEALNGGGIDQISLILGQLGFLHLKPDHVFARHQFAHGPVRGPGVEEDRLFVLKAAKRVSHGRGIPRLDGVEIVAPVIGFEMVRNH